MACPILQTPSTLSEDISRSFRSVNKSSTGGDARHTSAAYKIKRAAKVKQLVLNLLPSSVRFLARSWKEQIGFEVTKNLELSQLFLSQLV